MPMTNSQIVHSLDDFHRFHSQLSTVLYSLCDRNLIEDLDTSDVINLVWLASDRVNDIKIAIDKLEQEIVNLDPEAKEAKH